MAGDNNNEEHELYDGIDEEGGIVPTALIASFVVVILAGIIFTFPLWGARPAGDPFAPVTNFYNGCDCRPWWDIGYTMIVIYIAAVMGWIIWLIKKGYR